LKRKKLSFNFFFSNDKLLPNEQLFDYLVSVAESRNWQCHPCESRGLWRKSWIPAFAGMTTAVSATGTI
jgi:hypothetical protein